MSESAVSIGEKLRRNSALAPDAPAVSCGAATLTYGQLHRRTNRIARGLLARGVKAGDLVTVGLPNGIGFVEACHAIWKLGATPQPVSSRLPAVELAPILEMAQTPLVVGTFAFPLARPQVGVDDLLALSDDDSDLPDVVAPSLKAPTSGGSTGRPKLIVSTQTGTTTTAEGPVSIWRLHRRSVSILPAPLYHNTGFGLMLQTISAGGHLVVMPRFDPEATLAEIAGRRGTIVYLVPTMMSRIWRLPDAVRAGYDLGSLEHLWHLAAPCPPWLKEAFIHWVSPAEVMEMYGGTEGQAVTLITGQEWLGHRGSVGRVYIGEMKVVDEDGGDLPAGAVGEIYMRRGPEAAPTYQYLGATARSRDGGWESLGDIGWFDEEGYLYLADRRTDMILVGGSNVYPAEVEAALEEHPAVGSVAVIGLPDADLGARIHAILQAAAPVSEAELRTHLAERLVSYKQPRSYEFVDAPLRDDAGKVRRSALRAARIQPISQPEGSQRD